MLFRSIEEMYRGNVTLKEKQQTTAILYFIILNQIKHTNALLIAKLKSFPRLLTMHP